MISKPLQVKKIAILGAGVMGAQIAAHCVNAGIETLLFDLASEGNDDNAIVNKAIKQLTKLKPTPLAVPATINLLQAKNYDKHLDELTQCDLIIEAIAEKMEWKVALYEKIAPFVSPTAIIASNTSGLSINNLATALPFELQARFCGIHFFNPPRYMHLVEVIPHANTDETLINLLETLLVSYLGKGVVRAKDTPNFIANRIGVFSLISIVHHAMRLNIGFDVVDKLTGPILGRPKSGSFRTMDVVGLDTMAHVIHTMSEQLKDDPWHAYFTLPSWLTEMVNKGALGQKTRCGIYKKEGRAIHVFDINSQQYRPADGEIDAQVRDILAIKNTEERFKALKACTHPQAQFVKACFSDLFHYCAVHLDDIADTVRDVDLAVRWGFGWQQGPFETWQQLGLALGGELIAEHIHANAAMSNASLPNWLQDLKAFYKPEGAYSATAQDYLPRRELPVYQRQLFLDTVLEERVDEGVSVFENEGVRLWHQHDGIAVLSFKSKVGAIDERVIEGMLASIALAERDFDAMVIYQSDPQNFSAGANLKLFAKLFQQGDKSLVENLLARVQNAVMALKYSSIPVIGACRGRALGGGCEVLMHCDRVVAGFESYIGLVEVGVGLLPAAGGCTEFARRAATDNRNKDPFVALEGYYKSIAMAEVSSSAVDAQLKGHLRSDDVVVMNNHEVLFIAKNVAKTMALANYRPPLKQTFPVAGREGAARIKMLLVNMLEGHFISEYDFQICSAIAEVICGGEVDQGTCVDEAWLLRLERQAFAELASEAKTHERIAHLLKTGKPLRN